MSRITLDQANTIIGAAFAEGKSRGLKPLGVAVVDAGGHLSGAYRVDAVALRGGGGVCSHGLIHFLLMEKLSLLSELTGCDYQRFNRVNR